jgi:hypothetical protein
MIRFTIRDVLWLTVVVRMGLGWFLTFWATTSLIRDLQNDHYRLSRAVWERGLELDETDETHLYRLVPRKANESTDSQP